MDLVRRRRREKDGSGGDHRLSSRAGAPGPVTIVRAVQDAGGIVIGPRTGMSGWLGERLNVGYAIDVLHPLAATVRT
jgi:hypothetical protein